jgi:DNA-binding NarL/FixJ family response regulator
LAETYAEERSINADDVSRLTPEERDILALLAYGKSNHEIAEDLNVPLPTAEYGVAQVLRKLRVSDRMEAALWALVNMTN